MSFYSISNLSQVTKSTAAITIASALLLTTGCQSLKPSNAAAGTTPIVQTQKLDSFTINGKIGITIPESVSQNSGAQGGSAFYAWGQQQDRFAIELIGALGIGKTNIEYDGKTATLVSEKTGTLTADDPETLLQKATGWQAPISQLPYWISGRSAPSDRAPQVDNQGRLVSSANGNWSANFTYNGTEKLPNRITATQPQGQKVVMTINHQNR